uniref:DLEC1 cilia and flagella associated protein n=1 Tax=Sinocyclocheilus anshuiensis TaxID=1608454 RepID=A0A671RCN3_9TELE
MNRHKPASKTTQDISHLLASIFNDLYTIEVIGRDTVSNLSKSRRGSNNYHEKYVEELQQVHFEYSRRIQNADMLETHIIQARLQAAAKEEHEHNRIMEEVGEAYRQLGLPPVKSAFKWCVDSELLRSNNLICPLDYTTVHTPVVKSPKGNFSLTINCVCVCVYIVNFSNFLSLKLGLLHKASWMEKPSAQSRAKDRASLQKHKDQHKFLRNPRFLLPNAQRGGKSLIMPGKRPENVGKGMKNTGRERYKKLCNKALCFTGRFPGEGGIVAPGMSCQYMVRFTPDSLADYEDVLIVEMQLPYPLIIPIEAHRPPPILSLPSVMDCGYCLVGGVKFMEVLCRNEGLSAGTFCVMPKKQWPASSLRFIVKIPFCDKQPPFAISPSIFGLLPGQATVIEVVFFPTTAEISSQDFTIVCDNCQVKDITLQGTGQLVTVELVSISGGEDQPEFEELFPCTHLHLELPYHWQIMKPNLQCVLPEETLDPSSIQHHLDTDSVFSITPVMGILSPAQEHEFLLTYCPKDVCALTHIRCVSTQLSV